MNWQNRSILIVDDDQTNAAFLAKRLERRGYQATTISNPLQVFDYIDQHKIELVLLDIVMPQMDGMSLLKEIRIKFPKQELPVIMATALDDSLDVVDAFQIGANDYITKPIKMDILIARINAHLSMVDLHKEGIKKKELAAMNTLVATYNHEINNPLAIALGCLSGDLVKNEQMVSTLKTALWRVADIVKKIKDVTEKQEIEYENYADSSKVLKVK